MCYRSRIPRRPRESKFMNHSYVTMPMSMGVYIIVLGTGFAAPRLLPQGLSFGSVMRPSIAVYDAQCRQDIEGFVEEMYRFGDHPSSGASDRMLQRAYKNKDDPELLYWASRAAMKGWTSNAVDDGPRLLQAAADMGYKPAIRDLGILECFGSSGVSQNAADGMEKLRQIAGTGDSRALYYLAGVYANGLAGQRADLNLARQYMQRAIDGGYLPAAAGLGDIYEKENDLKHAEECWIRAADYGDTDAMEILVDPSRSTVTSRDQTKAYRYLTRGSIWGDKQLSRMLAATLLLSKSNPGPDDYLVQYLLQVAADNGDVRAMALQARARLQGLWYTTQDAVRARRELQWLADGVDWTGSAAFLLGQALWEGVGMVPDRNEAVKLVQKGADAGFKPAQAWLSSHDLNRDPTVSHPATYPSTKVEYQIAMQSLKATLLEASTKIDISPSGVSAPPIMVEADQALEDDAEFHEVLYYQIYPLSRPTIERIVHRACNGIADV